MTIQEISKITGLSAHTLRYYEKIGLLIHVKRDHKGHRYYSDKDLIWIAFIQRLKATNMPLNEIKAFAKLRVEGDKTIPQRVRLLEDHDARIQQQMDELAYHREKVQEKIDICRNGEKSFKNRFKASRA